MRLLITGGAGCLGSNLVEYYLPKGNEILVIDNFATGKREVLPNIKGLTVKEGSIADKDFVYSCFESFQPTHVIHSAASYKDPENWVEDSLTNILGTINVAKSSMNFKIEKLINFQTALCYGLPIHIPIEVNHPIAPFTSYGISKTAGEAYLLNSGLPVVSLRLANICAPRLAIGPIPTFYKRLKNNQNCFCTDSIRDFLDIQDFFDLMDIILLDNKNTGVFNVSTGEGHSIHDLYIQVSNYLGIIPPEVPIVPVGNDDVPVVVLDSSHTYEVFGWKAKVNFSDLISNQLQWYDKFGVNDVYSHLASNVNK
jgi:nucleoside-diphosphate-sugar epimerase